MRRATEALENVRNLTDGRLDTWQVLERVNDEIGLANQSTLQKVLVSVRDQLETLASTAGVRRLEELFAADPEIGWHEWRRCFAEGIASWRPRVCAALLRIESLPPAAEHYRHLMPLVLRQEWGDLYQLFIDSSQIPALGDRHKLRLQINSAQIAMWHLLRLDVARTHLESAAEKAPDDAELLMAWASYWRECENEYRYREFVDRLDHQLPDNFYAQIAVGDRHEFLGKPKRAAERYRKALTLMPGNAVVYSRLIGLYRHPGWAEAHESELEGLIERRIAVASYDMDGAYMTWVEVGRAFDDLGDIDNAETWYRKSADLAPDEPLAHLNLAMLAAQQGDVDLARARIARAETAAPDSFDVSFGWAALASYELDWPTAVRWYRECLRQRPGLAEVGVRVRIGQAYRAMQDIEAAQAELFKALHEAPTHIGAVSGLEEVASDLSQAGHPSDALKLLDKVRAATSDDYEGSYWDRRGDILTQAGDYRGAQEAYRRAIAAEPGNADYNANLVNVLILSNDFTAARAAIAERERLGVALEHVPLDIARIDNLEGNHLYEAGNYAGAARCYAESARRCPDDPVFHSNLASALEAATEPEPGERLNQLQEALTAAERAVQLDPDTAEYVERRDRLRLSCRVGKAWGPAILQFSEPATLSPVRVQVGEGLVSLITVGPDKRLAPHVAAETAAMRQRIFNDMGIAVPGIRFATLLDGGPTSFAIMLNDVLLTDGDMPAFGFFAPFPPVGLHGLNIEAIPYNNPVTGHLGSWLTERDAHTVAGAGHPTWSVTEFLLRHVEAVLRLNLAEFVGWQETVSLLSVEVGEAAKAVITDPALLAVAVMALRALAAERVPLQPLDAVLKAVDRKTSATEVVEQVRRLRSTASLTGGLVDSFPVTTDIERRIATGLKRGHHGTTLVLRNEELNILMHSLADLIGPRPDPVLVVQDPVVRPFIFELSRRHCPRVRVVAADELRQQETP
jgi:tetratricopeptide (TPR) repeat protein